MEWRGLNAVELGDGKRRRWNFGLRRNKKTLARFGVSYKVSYQWKLLGRTAQKRITTSHIDADDHQLIRTRYEELHTLHLYPLYSSSSSQCLSKASSTMLRSLPRAVTSSSSLRMASIRKPFRTPQLPAPACALDFRYQQTRSAAVHAISNPTLAGIEKRWEEMPPQEQADLWMALRDRMKNDWHDLTLQERKAGMLVCVSRGPEPSGYSPSQTHYVKLFTP